MGMLMCELIAGNDIIITISCVASQLEGTAIGDFIIHSQYHYMYVVFPVHGKPSNIQC